MKPLIGIISLCACSMIWAGSFQEGMDHGKYALKLSGKHLAVKEGDQDKMSGYQQVRRESDYDPTVAKYLKTNGLPNFIHQISEQEFSFYYLDKKQIVTFARPMYKLESTIKGTITLTDEERRKLDQAIAPKPAEKKDEPVSEFMTIERKSSPENQKPTINPEEKTTPSPFIEKGSRKEESADEGDEVHKR